jgi:hypothetical protein
MTQSIGRIITRLHNKHIMAQSIGNHQLDYIINSSSLNQLVESSIRLLSKHFMTQSIGRTIGLTTKVIGPTNFHFDSRSTRLDYNQAEPTFTTLIFYISRLELYVYRSLMRPHLINV